MFFTIVQTLQRWVGVVKNYEFSLRFQFYSNMVIFVYFCRETIQQFGDLVIVDSCKVVNKPSLLELLNWKFADSSSYHFFRISFAFQIIDLE